MNLSRFNLVNFLVFQAGWFVAVLGAAAGIPWAGILFTLAWVLLHLRAIPLSWRGEAWLLLAAAGAGYCVDTLLVMAGHVGFPAHAQFGGPVSLWMTALWINLAATLRYSLAWLAPWPLVASLFGAVGGPLAYYAGARLGALEMDAGPGTVGAIALAWALVLPALLHLAHGTRRSSAVAGVVRP